MKLSIVMCLYNTNKDFFEQALKSIRNSTLKKDEYEIVVIDDGSNENYSEIIKKYDPVYVKTENRGQMAARFLGILISKGEYVAFCDADDYVTFNYHAPMIKKAQESGADIVINDWAFLTERTRFVCGDDLTIKNDICYENNNILRFFASGKGKMHSYFVLWNKMYKKSLLLEAKKELEKTDAFAKKYTFSEDALYNFFTMKNAKKLVNTHTGYYFYRVHTNQSVVTVGEAGLKNEIDSMTFTFNTMYANLPENSFKDEIKANLKEWSEMMARKHYSYAKANKLEHMYDYIKEKYDTTKLQLSLASDSYAYIGTELLGDNFDDIERELYKFYRTDDVNLIYNEKDQYVGKSINYLINNEGKKINKSSSKLIIVPKRQNKLSHKFVYNKLIYKIGLKIFKKGSKARIFLKNKL
ncbi:MAG: glycosyltransferase family 2 protein [Clostridia bacterium]|nr:glycosyltransferase family 2 protein [Clostridia bacterium]